MAARVTAGESQREGKTSTFSRVNLLVRLDELNIPVIYIYSVKVQVRG